MRYVSRTWAGKSRGNSRLKRSKSRSSCAGTGGQLVAGACPGVKAGQPELGGRRLPGEHQSGHQLAHGRPVLEAVPRTAPHEPGVRRSRMPIDDEVLVGRVFVLAYTGLDQRSALQSRKPKREILARRLEALRCGHALAGRGIEWRPPGVVRDLEPAPLVARNAVDESPAVIGPHRQRLLRKPLVTGGRAEEKDLLPGGAHPVADNVRKQAPEPRAAGEHECIGDEGGAVRQFDAPQLASGGLWTGLRRELAVLAALGE